MKTTCELRQGELTRRVEDLRSAYQDRDIGRMLALFAGDAEVTAAPGTVLARQCAPRTARPHLDKPVRARASARRSASGSR